MIHIVSFSTGLSSAITAERVIKRFGADDVQIVFMDTKIEDEDNYRFQREMYQQWEAAGVQIVNLEEGRDPYQVGRDVQLIPNQKTAPCTFILKIEPFVKYLSTLADEITVYIGYDYTEVHRCEATKRNYGMKGWAVDFPLLWKPYEMRQYTDVCREDWGIEPPRMYTMGYTHANCGGLCVKQGKGDWIRTLVNFPELFAQVEQWEREMRDHPIRQKYALLRDQKKGVVSPMTLEQLRLEYEQGNTEQMSLLDFNGGCVVCGVGDLLAGEA